MLDMFRSALSRTEGGRRDDGVALVLAVMVGTFGVALTMIVVTTVIVGSQNSGQDRQRAVAVSAAEAGVDASFAKVQSAAAGTLPCTVSVTSRGSDVTTVSSTLKYYTSAGVPIACVSGYVPTASAANVAKAEILSTAVTSNLSGAMKATRKMEALVNIKPELNATLGDALYSSSTMTFANGARVTDFNNNTKANVYSNNQIVCNNGTNSRFEGDFVAQGSVTIAASCQILGDLLAKGAVSINNNGAYIAGYVRSVTSISAVPEGSTTMVRVLAEAPTISWDTCWTNSSHTTLRTPLRCQFTNPAAPVVKPFPVIRGDATAQAIWQADGYNVKVISSSSSGTLGVDCNTGDTNGLNGVTNWLKTNAPTWTGKTMVVNTCTNKMINLQNNAMINLKGDLAVFSYGGFSVQGGGYGTADGQGHTLHLVVPYDAATSGCSWQNGMTFNNNSIDTKLTTLVYSPCQVDIANNVTLSGQVYSGANLNVNNTMSVQYKQVPMPAGSIIAPGGTIKNFVVGVVYKRETTG